MKKRKICLLLAALQLILCVTGCSCDQGGKTPGEKGEEEDTVVYTYPSEIPAYEDTQEFEMVAFWSPPSTLEHYQDMVDCGFTSVVIDAKYGNTIGSGTLMDTLGICDQVGIKAYLAVERDQSFSDVQSYGKYESFAGVNTDEPLTKKQLDIIASNIDILNKVYPDQSKKYLTTLVNGATPEIEQDFGTFEAYVDYYFQNGGGEQKAFMYDIYPLQGSNIKGIINGNWLKSLEVMAAASKKYDVDLYSYLATMSIRSQSTRRPAEDDMRYVSYVNLAYGVKGFAYFCYMSPGGPPYDGEFEANDWALVNFTNQDDISTYYKTPTWEIVQKVNNEMKLLDHVILSYEWDGVMKSVGSEASTTAGQNCFREAKQWLKSHDGIRNFQSTEDAILGVFKDADGYDGFMLVNFADTMYDKENTVTLKLRGATRAVVYIKGEPQVVELVDETYTVTLKPGEGQFIIPLS